MKPVLSRGDACVLIHAMCLSTSSEERHGGGESFGVGVGGPKVCER